MRARRAELAVALGAEQVELLLSDRANAGEDQRGQQQGEADQELTMPTVAWVAARSR